MPIDKLKKSLRARSQSPVVLKKKIKSKEALIVKVKSKQKTLVKPTVKSKVTKPTTKPTIKPKVIKPAASGNTDSQNTARLKAKVISDAAATQAVVKSGGLSTDRNNRLKGETATQANIRITNAYKAQPKPKLTVEGEAAGATIRWVRTGAGGVGKYKEVYGMGVAIPKSRTSASGNSYDKNGNLIPKK